MSYSSRSLFGVRRRGQAIILVALTMMSMLLMLGLSVDAGQLFIAKRTMQEAADAASFAGAVVLYQGGTWNQAVAAATSDATLNGFTNNQNQTTITIGAPTSGPYTGDTHYIQVEIQKQVKTALLPAEAAFNPVRARSVGSAFPGKSPFVLMMLKPTGPCLHTEQGSTGSIIVSTGAGQGGMIQANCNGNSFDTQGNGTITDALGTRTVGTVPQPGKVLPAGSLTTGAAKEPDPFAGYPKPSTNGLPVFNSFSVPVSACNPATPLTPGVYSGGITNNQSCSGSGGKVYFGNGVFIIKGGGINNNASSGVMTTVAAGAMIFNTHTNYPGAKGNGTCGSPFQAQSGGGFDMYAPTSGANQGMALFEDPACTNSLVVNSQGAYDIHGTIYLPTAAASLTSQSAMTLHAQLVCYNLDFQSSGNLTITSTISGTANSGLPALIE